MKMKTNNNKITKNNVFNKIKIMIIKKLKF